MSNLERNQSFRPVAPIKQYTLNRPSGDVTIAIGDYLVIKRWGGYLDCLYTVDSFGYIDTVLSEDMTTVQWGVRLVLVGDESGDAYIVPLTELSRLFIRVWAKHIGD